PISSASAESTKRSEKSEPPPTWLSEAVLPITPPPSTQKASAPNASNKPDATNNTDQTYLAAVTKAQADCLALWADHALDPLRGKLMLAGDPTNYAMFADPERLRPQDKPLADLVIKTIKDCRALYAPALAMATVPAAVKTGIQGFFARQDALI